MKLTTSKKSLGHQQGAVLITALIFMIIMTMLAITSMGTNTLEEKMAANAAVTNISFQAAESGLETISNNPNAYNAGGSDFVVVDADYAGTGITVTNTSSYQQQTPAARGATPSDTSAAFHHFDFRSEITAGGIPTVLHSGAYQTGPKI